MVVRLYKLDIDYHHLVVRLLGLDVDYYYVDVDVQRPFPDVPYIRTMSHSVAAPFMHSKPYYTNHNPHSLFGTRVVVIEPAPWLMNPCCSYRIVLGIPHRVTDCHL